MKSIVIAAILIASAAPALANDAPAASTAELPKPKKVCRLADQATGSIMAPKHICHTPEEWAALDTAAAKARGPSNVAPPQVALDALVVK